MVSVPKHNERLLRLECMHIQTDRTPMIRGCKTLLCAFLLAAASATAQKAIRIDPAPNSDTRLGRLTSPYRARSVPPVNLSNSSRLESLVRSGNLYLSAQDVVALAIENNIDIEVQRYGPLLAREVLRRAEGGRRCCAASAWAWRRARRASACRASASTPTAASRRQRGQRREFRRRHRDAAGAQRSPRSIPRFPAFANFQHSDHSAEQHGSDRNYGAGRFGRAPIRRSTRRTGTSA